VAFVIRLLRSADRALCMIGRSCCVARSQGAWDGSRQVPGTAERMPGTLRNR